MFDNQSKSTAARAAMWALLAALAVQWEWRNWAAALRPQAGQLFDFSQEWMSARNFWTGRPAYTPQRQAMLWHTDVRPDREEDMLPWNAHPPTAVLLTLPFGGLSYANAHFAWNLLMLGAFAWALVVAARLRGPPYDPGTLLTLVAVLAVCYPLLEQTYQGQWNGLLALLMVGAWWADRRDRSFWAGLFIGIAAAVKLFPAFLFIYWLMRRQWRALLGGLAAFMTLNATAAVVLGGEAFMTYVGSVIPSVNEYRSSWANISLSGLWSKLFDPHDRERVLPLFRSPVLAHGLTIVCQLLVTGVVAQRCWHAASRQQRERALGLAVLGMLLVSPITWGHYLVLLLMPLAVSPAGVHPLFAVPTRVYWIGAAGAGLLLLWQIGVDFHFMTSLPPLLVLPMAAAHHLVLLLLPLAVPGWRPPGKTSLVIYRIALAIVWLPISAWIFMTMGRFAVEHWKNERYLLPPARPWQTLCGLAVQTYALCAVFWLYWRGDAASEHTPIEQSAHSS